MPLVTLPEVPPFPTEALPIWMREYVLALAIELQVPTDLPGILVLVAAAAGISRKVVVSPRPGWEKEPTNLYGMVSLPPGEKKSQTLRKALRPIAELECEMQECERPNIERAESEFKVAELRVQHLQQRIAKSDSAEDRAALKVELGRAIEERQAVVVPAIPYLSVDDDTPDKLAQELANQKGRLLVASAEPKALENISLYGDQPNFDVYLKGHAGDDLKVGRISRGRQSVTRPALSCLFTPQPLVLETLGATDALRGRGFLARWFYGLPISNVGYRDVNPPAMNAEVESNYSRWMKTLWRTEYAMDGEDIAPYELKLTSDALVLLHEFLQWIELELRPGGRLYGMAGWGNKLCGLAVRLSGVLHVAGNLNPYAPWTRKPIDSDTVQAAIGLARDYAVGHARAAFALMGEVEKVAHAKKVQKWLKQREDRYAEFSKRDCFNGCRGTFDTVDDLQPALDLLERHFLVRPKEMERKQGAGRNPSQVYSVSPSAFAEEAATHNPHFAQKACGGPLVGNSAESAHSARPPYSLNAQVKPKRTGSAKSTAKATTDSLFGELSQGLPD